MQPNSNVPVGRAPLRTERRLIEDVWRFDRKWINFNPPRLVEVPIPIKEEENLADLYAEETLSKMDMNDIDEIVIEPAFGKRQIIAIIALLTALACITALAMLFIDFANLFQSIIKRLY